MPVLLGLGIGFYFSLPAEPHILTALAPLAAMLALTVAAPRRTGVLLVLTALTAAAVGFALAKLRVEWVRAPVLAKQMSSVEVRGFVELVEPKAKRGQRVTLRVTSMGDLPPEARPYRVRVSTGKVTPGLQAGSAVHLRATLMPPAEPALPGDYDFARQAWFERLGALGYTCTAAEPDTTRGPAAVGLARLGRDRAPAGRHGARVTAVLPGQTGAIAGGAHHRRARRHLGGDQRRLPRLRHPARAVDLRLAHGDHGRLGVLPRAAGAGRLSVDCARYPIKKWAAAAAMLGTLAYLMISGSPSPPSARPS